MITIDSIQIGKVITEGDTATRDATTRSWTSAFRKTAVKSAVKVEPSGIVGDEVADRKHHGGPEKAMLCYPSIHYQAWSEEHPELDFGPGGFGENLTLADVSESDVCIGDRMKCGNCELEISQPRQPCWKISRRWRTKSMTREVTKTGRTGWYVRVISGGTLIAGEKLEIVRRPNPNWSIARANDILYGREVDRMSVHELMNLDQLSREWKDSVS